MLAWIEREAEANGLDSATTKRMQLVAEELFVNAIHHGFGAECDATIALALRIDDALAHLTFSDSAPPFDLRSAPALPADPARLGGVGLNLIRALSSAIRYRHEAGRNITTLDFQKCETGIPASHGSQKSPLSD